MARAVDLGIFDDVDVTYALMCATVMLAQERGALTAVQAANALGLSAAEYQQRRREMVALGRAINSDLKDAIRRERAA